MPVVECITIYIQILIFQKFVSIVFVSNSVSRNRFKDNFYTIQLVLAVFSTFSQLDLIIVLCIELTVSYLNRRNFCTKSGMIFLDNNPLECRDMVKIHILDNITSSIFSYRVCIINVNAIIFTSFHIFDRVNTVSDTCIIRINTVGVSQKIYVVFNRSSSKHIVIIESNDILSFVYQSTM